LLQGEELEFALSPKDPINLTKSFAVDLLEQLITTEAKQVFGCDLVLPAKKPKDNYSYFLINGCKIYADEISQLNVGKYRIFEIATPEVNNSTDVVRYDKAAEQIARFAAQLLHAKIGIAVECYKTAIAKGLAGAGYTTRGAHESYRVRKDFKKKINLLVPFLALRQLFCGSGGYYEHHPVISPRQFFVEREISEVSVPVPMICLRSESLSVDEDYIRLQILNGDPTRAQLPTFLRFALTSLIIQCIQGGVIDSLPEIEAPVEAARLISERCEARPTIRLQNGHIIGAVDYLQEYYLKPIDKYAHGIGLNGEMETARQVMEDVLENLSENKLERLNRKIEWVIKLDLFEWNFERYFDLGADIAFPKETANNTYCAVTDSLFDDLERELGIVRLLNDEEINDAIIAPPALSRANARAEIVRRYDGYVDEINWDYVIIQGQKIKLQEDVEWTAERISRLIREMHMKGTG
jgi:hypothetical protein